MAARSMCPTQSVPARVDNAYWNGAHSASNSEANCFARVRATNLRTEHPVAIPRTPPSGFDNAVNRAPINAVAISGGMEACAKLVSASRRRLNVSGSSNNVRLLGALFKLFMNIFRSMTRGLSGTNSRASLGIILCVACGLLDCISVCVASVPGANDAPVRHCRARDTSPNLTLRHAAA